MAQQISTNTFGVAKWVVSADATQGTHTTIAGAITSASSGDTIYIRDGSYTENLTLKVGVNLAAFSSNELAPRVIIIGNATLSTAGSVTISGIGLQTNGAALLTVSGTLASIVNLIDCNLNCTNATGISFSSSSASAAIIMINCTGDLGTTGIALYSSSSAGSISINRCRFTNTGASTTASSISAGTVFAGYSIFQNAFSTSSAATISAAYCNFGTTSINTTCITTAGTGASSAAHCEFGSGTASALSIGSGSSINLVESTIASSNTNAITGAGTLTYSALAFTSSSSTINVTTQTGGTLQGGVFQAPSAGYVGEQIRGFLAQASAVALANATAKTVTSITLTPGIWDISAIVGYVAGAITGTLTFSGIATTTNSLTGTVEGDNAVEAAQTATAASNYSQVIPSYRVTITASTSYFLVAFMLFTVGSPTAWGRISATRVG